MAVFTDYSKAFVTIDFYTLTQKMHSLNFFFFYKFVKYTLYKLTYILCKNKK